MQKITPCLWFDKHAEEAVNFYLSVFREGKIKTVTRYPAGTPGPTGSVMTIVFELFGQEYLALNGGPHFKFNEAVSLVVNCKDQQEIDLYWSKLTAGGGQESMCGWLKDKYGLSWQIVPQDIEKMLSSGDEDRTMRVMGEVMKMKKLDLGILEAAYKG